MSVTRYATALYGFRLVEKTIRKEDVVRGCKHKVPDDATFCPKCGKPVWETKVYEDPEIDLNELLGDLPKGYTFQQVYGNKGNVFYVGYGKTLFDDGCVCLPLMNDKLKDEILEVLRGILEPVGLFDPGQFQLYFVYETN